LALLGVWGLALAAASPAFADPPTDGVTANGPEEVVTPDGLRDELVAGRSDGDWRGILETRIFTRSADEIAQVLRPLFADRERRDALAPLVAYAAAFLADHPHEERLLLAPEVLARAYGDPAFVAAMRGHLTKFKNGWDRMLEHAMEAAGSGEGQHRVHAIWWLTRERDGARGADVLAHLRTIVAKEAREESSTVAEDLLGALQEILGFRFASLKEADTFLAETAGRPVVDVIRAWLARSPDRDGHRDLAIEWGTRLVTAATGPEGLVEFLDPRRTPYPEVRRAAIRKAVNLAGQIQRPEDAAAWATLLCTVFTQGEDAEVLGIAILMLERLPSETPAEAAAAVASCASRRLRRTDESTPEAERVRLAKQLGRLGAVRPVLEAIEWARDAQPPVDAALFTELILAGGHVDGGALELLLDLHRRSAGEDPRNVKIRQAVAHALGRAGIAANEGVAASAALRGMLVGSEGQDAIARDPSRDVRDAATMSLQMFPGPETAAALLKVALDPASPEATTALQVLRAHYLQGNRAAADALVAVAAAPEVPKERREAALKDLARLALPADAELLRAVRDGVRAVAVAAEAGTAPEVRRQALDTLATLGDPGSLDVVLAHWKESPAERLPLLRRLLDGVVRTAPKSDERVHGEVSRIVLEVGAADSWDTAVEIAKALAADATPPFALQLLRARVHARRAEVAGRDEAARLEDLKNADVFLESALAAPTASPVHEEGVLEHVRVLLARAKATPPGADRRTLLMRGIDRAFTAQTRPVAELGLQLLAMLDEQAKTEPIPEAQRQRVADARAQFERLARG
jgi:hypothetical protein